MILKKTNIVFLAELLAQWRAHNRASHAGGLSEELLRCSCETRVFDLLHRNEPFSTFSSRSGELKIGVSFAISGGG